MIRLLFEAEAEEQPNSTAPWTIWKGTAYDVSPQQSVAGRVHCPSYFSVSGRPTLPWKSFSAMTQADNRPNDSAFLHYTSRSPPSYHHTFPPHQKTAAASGVFFWGKTTKNAPDSGPERKTDRVNGQWQASEYTLSFPMTLRWLLPRLRWMMMTTGRCGSTGVVR